MSRKSLPRPISIIWDHGTRVKVGEDNKWQCGHCSADPTLGGPKLLKLGSSTSHVMRHLRNVHGVDVTVKKEAVGEDDGGGYGVGLDSFPATNGLADTEDGAGGVDGEGQADLSGNASPQIPPSTGGLDIPPADEKEAQAYYDILLAAATSDTNATFTPVNMNGTASTSAPAIPTPRSSTGPKRRRHSSDAADEEPIAKRTHRRHTMNSAAAALIDTHEETTAEETNIETDRETSPKVPESPSTQLVQGNEGAKIQRLEATVDSLREMLGIREVDVELLRKEVRQREKEIAFLKEHCGCEDFCKIRREE